MRPAQGRVARGYQAPGRVSPARFQHRAIYDAVQIEYSPENELFQAVMLVCAELAAAGQTAIANPRRFESYSPSLQTKMSVSCSLDHGAMNRWASIRTNASLPRRHTYRHEAKLGIGRR